MVLDDVNARAQELMRSERWELAIELIEQVPMEARSADLNWNHGWALFKLDRFERAAQSLRRAVLQRSTHAVSHWALGVVLQAAGDPVAAEKHLRTALSLRDSGLARLSLAVMYMEQGRLDEAERIHVEGLELKPDDKQRVEAYADFLSDCGREPEARVQYARAAELPEKPSRKRGS